MVDFAYPLFVTPLQGTLDHAAAIADGTLRSWDPNDYTTRQPVRDWFEHASMSEIRPAYNQAFFHLFSVRNILTGGSPGLRADRFVLRLLARAMAEGGRRVRGVPFHYTMEGWPRKSGVTRPADGYRGMPLTVEDVAPDRKRECLRSLGACFSAAA